MGAMASQITSLTIVYLTVYSGADQRKHQSYASLAYSGIYRSPVNSPPHKWPVTSEIFPFHDVIMMHLSWHLGILYAQNMCTMNYSFWGWGWGIRGKPGQYLDNYALAPCIVGSSSFHHDADCVRKTAVPRKRFQRPVPVGLWVMIKWEVCFVMFSPQRIYS